jgi:CubicO group peptidase (beta-lactamase class C family)
LTGDLGFDPGTQKAYSSAGYQLLQISLEAATGKPWWDVVYEKVCAPLGLHMTSVAATNIPLYDIYKGEPLLLPKSNAAAEEAGTSGGLYSSARDLTKFARGWGSLLDPESIKILALTGDEIHKSVADRLAPGKQLFKTGHLAGGRCHIIMPLPGEGALGGEVLLSNVSKGVLEWEEERG